MTSRAPLDRTLDLAWSAFLACGAALFLAVSWTMLRYPHEVVVSEAAVGLCVKSVLDGVPLYSAQRLAGVPFVILHYTPVYYLVVAPLMAATGALFAAGRAVSIASTIATGILAGLLARRVTGNSRAGLVAGLVWLSFYQVVFWGTTQRVDALGIAFDAAGLLAAVKAREGGRTPWGSIPWFLAAWLTKQVMVVGLVATTLDLILRDWRRGLRFGAAGLGTIAAAFAALTAWSGGAFWTATVLGTVSRHADPPWVIFSNAELFFGSPWNMLLTVLAIAGAVLAGERLMGIVAGFGLIFAIATDANFPRFFPPMLAAAVLVPVLLERVSGQPAVRRGIVAALVFFGAAHGIYEMRSLVRERIVQLGPSNSRLALAREVEAATQAEAPVLAQDTGMVLSAHRSVTIADPLVLSILAGNGAWNPDVLSDGIRGGRFGAIVLNRPLEAITDAEWTTLWIAPVRRQVADRYRLAATLHCAEQWRFLEPDRYVYVPKERP